MSIESARSFVERMKADEDFCKKVMSCKDTESRMDFVKSAGFDFTSQEIKTVSGELSDTDLDNVSGGYGGICDVMCDHQFYCVLYGPVAK